MSSYNIDAYRERFHRPDLVAARLSGSSAGH
jgi:hypothetical protein